MNEKGTNMKAFILFRFLNHIKALQKSAIISSKKFSMNHYLKTQLNEQKSIKIMGQILTQ